MFNNNKEKGYLSIILHAHLPFVRHPEYSDFLEEDWFYEAITESYIPLINMMDGLVDDGVDFRLTMSLSPTLLSMLLDPLLQSRYLKRLDKLIDLAIKETERTIYQTEFSDLAFMYKARFLKARDTFLNMYNKNLVNAFKKFQDIKKLEIITCPATHPFLPLLKNNPSAVRAQIETGIRYYEDIFVIKPAGIWLPECGFYPGLDEILKECDIRYFFLETHGILNAIPAPKYGVYRPVYCNTGIAAFGRDSESSKQVWSAEEGYPGDYDYREFYRDIAHYLEYDYIRPYLHDGIRSDTGIKYYRITGNNHDKQPYVPESAEKKAFIHAENFIYNRERQIERLNSVMKMKPIVIAPYDAELFGHWWFEGPDWLNFLFRKIASGQDIIKLITPSEYLSLYPAHQVCSPSMSSWGCRGYNEVWINNSNDWIYRHLHSSADKMSELSSTYKGAKGIKRKALNQAARELLLAQSSDWAFIMKSGTMTQYAIKRTKNHLLRFLSLYDSIKSGKINERLLKEIEERDNIFPDIDYTIYDSDKI
ncbi:MAG: glycoside hydrolase family 57 protein [Nitrospirota bacterium]